jgi:hypothetical protein
VAPGPYVTEGPRLARARLHEHPAIDKIDKIGQNPDAVAG